MLITKVLLYFFVNVHIVIDTAFHVSHPFFQVSEWEIVVHMYSGNILI